MKLVNQRRYFERRGDGFVFRPTVFSAGVPVSSEEKDRLVEAFDRIEKRYLVEAVGAVALIAGALMTGIVASPAPIPWFLLLSVLAAALLALVAVHRRSRAIARVLGRRAADVPRLPLRVALTRPRPVLPRRHAVLVLRSVVGLFALTTVVIDLLAAVPILAAVLPRRLTDRVAGDAVVADALAHTLYSVRYWLVVAAINVVLLLCLRLLAVEIRRLRAQPDIDEADQG